MLAKRLKKYGHFLKSLWKINTKLLSGMWKLTKVPAPAVTVFGGARLSQDDKYAKLICALTKKLSENGYSIITGGGPGIMEAANLGAYENHKSHMHKKKKLYSVGIGVARVGKANEYIQENIVMPYFFIRKWLLTRSSCAFIVGPGGFGTLDELSEIVTLIQTHKMPKTPIILIGKKYWWPLLDWVYESGVKNNLIPEKDAKLLNVTDDIDLAYNLIKKSCKKESPTAISAESKEPISKCKVE